MKPALWISITGLEGFTKWPLVNSVDHVEPDGNVVISGLPSSNCVVDVFHGDTWVTSVSVVVNGSMVLPSHLFTDAIASRLRLVLTINGEVYGGYIIFLPVEESEPFSFEGTYISTNGETGSNDAYVTTDYVDVSFVDDIVYNGRISYASRIAIAAYDLERNFVKILLERSDSAAETHHFEPDGSYNYIRASSLGSINHSLQVYYKSRRRR